MGKYFGTDGFRGEANKNLTYEHAVKIGRFLGWYYGAKEGRKANRNYWRISGDHKRGLACQRKERFAATGDIDCTVQFVYRRCS